MDAAARIRWAPRLSPRLLERLYQSDASGLRDLELCDDVGMRLHERCRAFVLVHEGRVECPLCREVFALSPEGESRCPGRSCRWFTTRRTWRESIQNHYAYPGRAMGAFAEFHRRWPEARSYPQKILLIDTLIHAFHVDEASGAPAKSVASKLLEGSKNEVVAFLDRLSAVDPDTKRRWRELAAGTIHARVVKK